CGACNGLDEYTYYLTPGQLAETYASLKGEVVGVGIEDVAVEEGKLIIKALLPGSAATKAGLQVGDRILRLDKKPVDNLTGDGALDRFRGEVGTTIDLEILSPGYREPRLCTLTREAVQVKSVVGTDMLDPRMGIGYFQLVDFQESTVQEMDDAITSLQMQGMKALILDLRGNPGGLFEVAIQIAERFLAEGIIVATQSPVHSQNKTYEANNLEALDFPLVVLIDGDTASAAEVVAGALKENRRATLVGQTTYGKGSIQCVVKLDTVPAGIRITLAKFFSPQGHPYNGCGVTPHIVVDRTSHGFDEAQRLMALQEARQMLMMRH
ncbi:MAG: S41 family peptidase, partial [Planctomycetes bacterium]|nr:S41 family peptidase [Planctomycetota bacterium]